MFSRFQSALLMIAIPASVIVAAGCGQSANQPKGSSAQPAQAAIDASGWWCAEHGVPEAECSMCSSKAAADFKKKNDWCKEHNRAESQCFICEPSRAEKYAALYEAKFGQKPPIPEANTREQ